MIEVDPMAYGESPIQRAAHQRGSKGLPELIEGDVVHYVVPPYGNSPRVAGEHRPAIVVKIWRMHDGNNPPNGVCQLQVFMDSDGGTYNDGGPAVQWATSVVYDGSEEPAPHTWHWIERQ